MRLEKKIVLLDLVDVDVAVQISDKQLVVDQDQGGNTIGVILYPLHLYSLLDIPDYYWLVITAWD